MAKLHPILVRGVCHRREGPAPEQGHGMTPNISVLHKHDKKLMFRSDEGAAISGCAT